MPDLPDDARPVELARRPRIKAFIRRGSRPARRAARSRRELVVQFGPAILAAPPNKGFDLLAWLLPLAALLVGAVVVGVAAWHWSRSREPAEPAPPSAALDPDLERRVDEELARFDA